MCSVGAIRVTSRARLRCLCHQRAQAGNGPKGTGLLSIAKDAQSLIRPMALEESYRTSSNGTGVVNLPGILGLGEAIRYLDKADMTHVETHNLELRNTLAERLRASTASRL